MDRIAIVGHGPSLLAQECGADIDAHDQVIRMKASQHLREHPQCFGMKVDHVLCSFTVAPSIQQHWPTVNSFFIFMDTRHEMVPEEGINNVLGLFQGKAIIDRPLCDHWIKKYRMKREVQELDTRQETKGDISDENGHRHPSAGTFAICYALEHLCPDELTLYGFDNLLSGKFDWSVTRGPEWDKYPDHNWAAEKAMISDICDYYGYEFNDATFKAVKK